MKYMNNKKTVTNERNKRVQKINRSRNWGHVRMQAHNMHSLFRIIQITQSPGRI